MKQRLPIILFAVLILIYVSFVLATPTDPHILSKYHLTQFQARLLNLTIIIPMIAIWLTALYGFLCFKAYAFLITKSTEGGPLTKLADGLMLLAFTLPATSAISAVFAYVVAKDPSLLQTTAILKNYIALALSLIAYMYIAKGARGLARTSNSKKKQVITFRWATPLLIVLSVVYTWFIVARPFGGAADSNVYYLPEWLIIFTIVIPYLYAWYQGIVATYFLGVYKSKVKGSLYKQAFADLWRGIGVVVAISILIRLITTLSSQLNRLDLTPVLAIVYLLVIGYAVGFGLVARGSKKLAKIEEV